MVPDPGSAEAATWDDDGRPDPSSNTSNLCSHSDMRCCIDSPSDSVMWLSSANVSSLRPRPAARALAARAPATLTSRPPEPLEPGAAREASSAEAEAAAADGGTDRGPRPTTSSRHSSRRRLSASSRVARASMRPCNSSRRGSEKAPAKPLRSCASRTSTREPRPAMPSRPKRWPPEPPNGSLNLSKPAARPSTRSRSAPS
mmetsp:Transcript_20569/g.57380  ORF Transcript_20569/g.57380 Transcript_20569/m.57380 type:complete len:201 (+) Transcript_20569:873-1475(+)